MSGRGESRLRRPLPVYFGVILLAWAIIATLFAVTSAATNFTVKTPFVADIYASPGDIKVEKMDYAFSVMTNRYSNISLEVKNYDSVNPHSGMVYIKMYSAEQALIAEGTVGTGTISQGVRQGGIYLVLSWYGSYTVDDFASAKLTLVQST